LVQRAYLDSLRYSIEVPDRFRLTPAESQASRRCFPYAIAASGIVLGVAIRLWVAAAAEGKSFSDNAVVALMAMHALRGKFYAFYWGQSYMGSLGSIVVSPFFALLAIASSPWACF
jgi:hypothetical protein